MFKAHRFLHHSTLGLRVIKQRRRHQRGCGIHVTTHRILRRNPPPPSALRELTLFRMYKQANNVSHGNQPEKCQL